MEKSNDTIHFTNQALQITPIIAQAIHDGYPFALWRLPSKEEKHIIVQIGTTTTPQSIDIHQTKEAGFLISPFINPNLEQSHWIKADLHLQFNSQETYEDNINIIRPEYKNWLENALHHNKDLKKSYQHLQFNTNTALQQCTNNEAKEHYTQLVKKGIQAIHDQLFQKVVLSRPKPLPIHQFDAWAFFHRLCQQYPQAFVSVFYLPKKGFWIGASPEIIVQQNKNGIFRTVALAGTQPYQPQIPLQNLSWTQKEIEEQALVSRYIINSFKKIRLREFDEIGPKTVQAGNLVHLKTLFEVDTQAVNFPNLSQTMLHLLHPTSAVCGMPKAESLEFILQNEQYERQFYSGFLGPVGIDQEIHLFVNLRSMQWFGNTLELYIGAGITADSVPEKEWNETEIKSQTLASLLVF